MQRNRIRDIDIMKGIAIILVVCGHYGLPAIIRDAIFSFHMPLFVFLNGYFCKQKEFTAKLKSNVKVYLKPYIITWFSILIFECLHAVITSKDAGLLAFQRFLSGIYAFGSNSAPLKPEFIPKIGVIWFLMALFFSTLIFNGLLHIKNSLIQLSMIIILYVIGMKAAYWVCIPLDLIPAVSFLPWLYMGYLWKNKFSEKIRLNNSYVAVIIGIIWCLTAGLEYKLNTPFSISEMRFHIYGLEWIGALAGIALTKLIAAVIDREMLGSGIAKLLSYFGNHSIWIMCVHGFSIEIFGAYWDKLYKIFSVNNIPGYLLVLPRTVLDIGLALVCCYLYKRYWENKKCLE